MIEKIIACPNCNSRFKLQAKSEETLRNSTFRCPKCKLSQPLSQVVGTPAAAQSSPYAPSPASSGGVAPGYGKTVIAGMQSGRDGSSLFPREAAPVAVSIRMQERPVAGILFSVSRLSNGEIFPVYVGRNTIGNDPDADIYLSEATVSPNHAVLLIRKLRLADGTVHTTMNISDPESQYGTFINGMRLDEEVEPLQSGDVIQIGNSYQFLFVPLDPSMGSLATDPAFQSTARVQEPPVNAPHPSPAAEQGNTRIDQTVYPNAVGEADEMTFYGRTVKKKEDRSSNLTVQQ